MTDRPLPDVPALLAALVATVPRAERPLFLAIAERMAAERYREWADVADDPAVRAGLLACAAREDEIAARVEALHPDAPVVQARLRAAHPDLARLTAEVFGSRPLTQQLAIQAAAERTGAAAWRALAERAPDEAARAAFLACAPLEEASAVYLESLAPKPDAAR